MTKRQKHGITNSIMFLDHGTSGTTRAETIGGTPMLEIRCKPMQWKIKLSMIFKKDSQGQIIVYKGFPAF